jgi:hypothetical protein
MKFTALFAIAVSLIGSHAFAEGFLSRFELSQGKTSECPLVLDIQRKNNTIVVKTENSASMNGVGPFTNTLYFSDFNTGWIAKETNSAGTFSSKVDLTLSPSLATLSSETKLAQGGSVLTHTRITLKVADTQEATLEYRILTQSEDSTLPAYADIECSYQEAK